MRTVSCLVLCLAMLSGSFPAAAETNIRVVGGFSLSNWTKEVEAPFFKEKLPNEYGLDLSVVFTPVDQLGVKFEDVLRMVNTNIFDLANTGVGNVAKDYPLLEGIDIAGAFPGFKGLREASDAIRPEYDRRLQEKFQVKLLTLWPFGPLGVFCRGEIAGIDDLSGKKIRVFTKSQSQMVEELGGTAVSVQANEVYSALQRGLLDCAVTAASFGNNLKWVEVTDTYLDIGMAQAVTGHLMSLKKWQSFTDHEQLVLTAAFRELENQYWLYSLRMKDDADRCNSGQDPCQYHTKYDLTLVHPSEEDYARFRRVAQTVTVPSWAKTCEEVSGEDCAAIWNRLIAPYAGFAIK